MKIRMRIWEAPLCEKCGREKKLIGLLEKILSLTAAMIIGSMCRTVSETAFS